MCAIIPTFRMREVLILPIVLECIDRLPGNRVDFANLVSIPGHCFSIYPRFRIRNICPYYFITTRELARDGIGTQRL